MKLRVALLVASLAAGCAKTGNPREGGLFGWSESMARQRIVDRETAVARTRSALAAEARQTDVAVLQRHRLQQRQQAVAAENQRLSTTLAEREASVIQKARELEAASATPALASRARRLRRAAEAARADLQLSPTERVRELRRLEMEIESAAAEARR